MKEKVESFNATVQQNLTKIPWKQLQGCMDGSSHGLLELIWQQSLLSVHFSSVTTAG